MSWRADKEDRYQPPAFETTNRFVIFSWGQAKKWTVPGTYAVISINDPEDTAAQVHPGFVDRLTLFFHDIDESSYQEGDQLFDEAQAKQILEFWLKHKDSIDRFMIHCKAGQCRSAGVGVALARLERDGDAENACYTGTMPNMHIARIIGRKAREMEIGPYAKRETSQDSSHSIPGLSSGPSPKL